MAVITTLILTRHGEAHCNVGGDRACTGLTGRGRHQVELLADRLHAEEPCHVLYATTRRRARESAEVLSGKLGLPVHVEPGLTGPHHGDADGRAWDEIKTAFGGPPYADPDRSYAPGSKTWNQYLARASATLADVLERHHGQRILIAQILGRRAPLTRVRLTLCDRSRPKAERTGQGRWILVIALAWRSP